MIKSDRAYLAWLQQELPDLVDKLALNDLQKQTLRDRWLDQVLWMESRANKTRNWYYALRLAMVIGGILIPLAITIGQASSHAWFAWIATGLGTLVAVAAAVEAFFHYGERWRNYRNTAELLKSEGWHYLELSGAYGQRGTHAELYEKFTAKVESIIRRALDVYLREIVGEREQEETRKAPVVAEPAEAAHS